MDEVVKKLADALKGQWEQGKPYRDAAVGLFQGNSQPTRQLLNQKSQVNPMTPEQALAFALDWSNPMGMVGHTVFHGSPHRFNKFDMSKIGTGEGAQAYGHGLYFAENPKVAKEYQLALGNKPAAVDDFAGFEAQAAMAKNKGHVKNSIAWLQNRKKTIDEAKQFLMPGEHGKQIADIDEAIRRISSGEVNKSKGNFYKVDIPDEVMPKMLDLYEAVPDDVLKPISKAMLDEFGSGASKGTGEQLYKQVVDEFKFAKHPDPKNAAIDWLKKHGVPGLRYLDQGSRSTGKGSYNYVVFDDSLPKILEINGKKVAE